MSITIICPHCGEIFKVPIDEVTGQTYSMSIKDAIEHEQKMNTMNMSIKDVIEQKKNAMNMSIKDAIEQKKNVINAISQDIFQGGQYKDE